MPSVRRGDSSKKAEEEGRSGAGHRPCVPNLPARDFEFGFEAQDGIVHENKERGKERASAGCQ